MHTPMYINQITKNALVITNAFYLANNLLSTSCTNKSDAKSGIVI